jgi:putative transposase
MFTGHPMALNTLIQKEGSRFQKLSHTIWHCQYHIVWVPKYRYKVSTGSVQESITSGIEAICGYAGCEIQELNVQKEHIHMVALVPPKIAISDLMGRVKGQTSIKIFNQYRQLRKKPYYGNHFWTPGYCVDTVGMDEEKIRKYVRYQGEKEKQYEQLKLNL